MIFKLLVFCLKTLKVDRLSSDKLWILKRKLSYTLYKVDIAIDSDEN